MKTRSCHFSLIITFTLLLILSVWLVSTIRLNRVLATDWGQMPLIFVANQGQEDKRVAFSVQGRDKTLYFTPQGVTFGLTIPPDGEDTARLIIKLDFLNANTVLPVGQEPCETVVSYFKGSSDQWHTNLPTYSQIVYYDLWAGIDLIYNGKVGQLKYEFVVQPGVDPARIRLAYHGAKVKLNEAGQFEVSTPAGSFTDDTPFAYQDVYGERIPVTVAFDLDDTGTYGFIIGDYDPTLPLVIDPVVLIYCGFIGGSNSEGGYGTALTVDTTGNAYVTGDTFSSETTFPVTVGPDLTYSGNDDAS
jgi:hypothetical protein